MFREVELPKGIKGRLYLHSMPGRNDPLEAVCAEIRRSKISALVCLAPVDEIREKLPQYAEILDRGAVPCTVLPCPIRDYHGPDDDDAFVETVVRAAGLLQAGDGVLIHCAGGIGRTGMFAVATPMALGLAESEARRRVDNAGSGPERPVQNEALRRIGPRLAKQTAPNG